MSSNRSAYIAILVTGMLCTGAANSLFSKFQDNVCVADCDTENPRLFEQPVWQTLQMFIGEAFCMVVFKLLASPTSAVRRRLSRSSDRGSYTKVDAGTESESLLAQDESLLDNAASPVQVKEDGTEVPRAASAPVPAPLPPVLDEANVEVGANSQQLKGATTFLLALPAIFDLTGTTLMNIGLLFTPVSVYQMTRSALVLWVGLFSVLYLNRKLSKSEIISLFIVCLGVFIVGLSSAFGKDSGKPIEVAKPISPLQVVIGISIILFAQVLCVLYFAAITDTCITRNVSTAAQFVIEEKIMGQYSAEPLRVVGYEGIFGGLVTLIVLVVGWAAVGRSAAGRHGYFDAPEGFHQMFSTRAVWASSIAICISIGCFNFFGLAVTRSVSATARSTIDTCRTVLIWAVSLSLGWEQFKILQVLGFVVLVYGTFAFNGLVTLPGLRRESVSI